MARKKARKRVPILPAVLAEWSALGYVTVEEAAVTLGVAKSTLYNTIAAGRFPKGKMLVVDAKAAKTEARRTTVKTSSTLWVLRVAVAQVIEERAARTREKASARARVPRRPSAAELASGAA